MVSIRRKILLKGEFIKEQLIRVLQSHEDRITTLEGGEAGELLDISALKETVGDEDGGLVKSVTALETTVGNSDSGLVKDVADLKAATITLADLGLETTEVVVTYPDATAETVLLVKQSSS